MRQSRRAKGFAQAGKFYCFEANIKKKTGDTASITFHFWYAAVKRDERESVAPIPAFGKVENVPPARERNVHATGKAPVPVRGKRAVGGCFPVCHPGTDRYFCGNAWTRLDAS